MRSSLVITPFPATEGMPTVGSDISVESGRRALACLRRKPKMAASDVCSGAEILVTMERRDLGGTGELQQSHSKGKKPAPESAQLVGILDLVILPVLVMMEKSHGRSGDELE